jgi:hypothetical protein
MPVIKKCYKCNIEKYYCDFGKNSSKKDGLSSECQKCKREIDKRYRNLQDVKIKKKIYNSKYIIANKENLKQYFKQHYKNNRDYISKRNKEYKITHVEFYTKYNREYKKEQRKSNIQFKLAENLRCRLNTSLKNNFKKGSAVRDLGCSIEDFKWWLEFWFDEGMSWGNYGNKAGQWSIDHIKPLSKFNLTDRRQVLEVCNYKNLQPMWHRDNLSKGAK